MAKKGKKSVVDSAGKPKSSWRSPTTGYYEGVEWMERRVLRLVTLHSPSARGETISMLHGAMMPVLLELLGDHKVEITVNQSNGKLAYELECAGWNRGQYNYFRRSILISELSKKDVWISVTELMKRQREDIWRMSATRGGGKHRHEVWSMTRDHWPPTTDMRLLLKHVSYADDKRIQDLLQGFFCGAVSASSYRYGYAELTSVTWPNWLNTRISGETLETQLRYGYLSASTELTDAPWLTIAPVMALSARHAELMGGIESMKREYGKLCMRLNADYEPFNDDSWRPFGKCGEGCLVNFVWPHLFMFEDVDPQLNPCLLDLLARHQVLNWSIPGGLVEAVRLDNERSKALRDAHAGLASVDTISLTESQFRHKACTILPGCVRFGSHNIENLPQSAHTASNRVWVRLRSRGGNEAVTIYALGRKGSDERADPVSVGSLDADDASLYFDSRVHGHDAEQEESGKRALTPRRLRQFACPACAGRIFHAWAGFEYHFDDPHFANAELAERCQDVFDWFDLVAACVSCKWHGEVVSVECA